MLFYLKDSRKYIDPIGQELKKREIRNWTQEFYKDDK